MTIHSINHISHRFLKYSVKSIIVCNLLIAVKSLKKYVIDFLYLQVMVDNIDRK